MPEPCYEKSKLRRRNYIHESLELWNWSHAHEQRAPKPEQCHFYDGSAALSRKLIDLVYTRLARKLVNKKLQVWSEKGSNKSAMQNGKKSVNFTKGHKKYFTWGRAMLWILISTLSLLCHFPGIQRVKTGMLYKSEWLLFVQLGGFFVGNPSYLRI